MINEKARRNDNILNAMIGMDVYLILIVRSDDD